MYPLVMLYSYHDGKFHACDVLPQITQYEIGKAKPLRKSLLSAKDDPNWLTW
jgi:hypothetical protein